MQVKVFGKVEHYDQIRDTITFKMSMLSPDLRRQIELLAETPSLIVLNFDSNNNNKPKTYNQLTRYFAMLKAILIKLQIDPNSKNLNILDNDIKSRALQCDFLEIEGRRLPEPPSKASMTIEQLQTLMEFVETTYSYLKIDWNKENWYDQ